MTEKILERAAAALTSLDTEALVSLYAEEFILEDTSAGERITDKQKLRNYFSQLFSLPEVQFSEVDFFSCGDRGAGTWLWSGLSPKTGKPYRVRGASLFVLGEERIRKETIFYDPDSPRS